jgi:hypothetical protein
MPARLDTFTISKEAAAAGIGNIFPIDPMGLGKF